MRIPADFPVRPLAPGQAAADRCTCNTCGRSWDDAIVTAYTPAPSARCPFEAFHASPRRPRSTSRRGLLRHLQPGASILVEAPPGRTSALMKQISSDALRLGIPIAQTLIVGVELSTRRVVDIVRVTRTP